MAAPATHPHLGLLLPLCTSSASLGLALYQFPIVLTFMHQPESESTTSIAGRPFSQFSKIFARTGGSLALSGYLTSTVSGFLAWRWLKNHGHLETTEVANWYLWGSTLAVLHHAFLPLLAAPLQTVASGADDAGKISATPDSQVEERNKQLMDYWLVVHTIRTLTVDFGAVWCFAKGVELALWVV